MADKEIVMSVKADIKSAKKQFDDLNKSIEKTEQSQKNLNDVIKEQNQIVYELEAELIELERIQAKIGKGTWQDSITGTSRKIEDQKNLIKETKLDLKNLNQQRKDNSSELKEQTSQLDKLNKKQKENDKTIKDGIGNFRLFGVSINDVQKSLGRVIPTIKLMFASIKTGIMSTGIGALLIAFGTLATYFTSTKRGADALSVVFAGLGAAVNVLRDRISKVGETLFNIFDQPIAKTLLGIKDAFTGITEEVVKEVAVMTALEKRFKAQRDAEIEFSVQRAETRKEIEKARLLAEDETKSQEVRIEALKKALDFETQTVNKELELAKEKVAIQEEQMETAENKVEAEKKLADLRVALINTETKSFRLQKRVQTEINELEREIQTEKDQRAKDEQKRLDDENQKIEDANQKKLDQQKTFDEKLIELNNATELLLISDEKEKQDRLLEIQLESQKRSIDALDISEQQKIALKNAADKKYNAQKLSNEEKLAEDTLKIQAKVEDAKRGLIEQGFDIAGELAGESDKAQKGVAVAKTIYNTQQAIMNAMANIPAPFNVATAVSTGIMGALAVKNILSASPDSTSTSGSIGMSGSSGTPAPEMLSGKFELTPNAEQQPVQAYVVTDNLTDNQNKLAYIRRRATI